VDTFAKQSRGGGSCVRRFPARDFVKLADRCPGRTVHGPTTFAHTYLLGLRLLFDGGARTRPNPESPGTDATTVLQLLAVPFRPADKPFTPPPPRFGSSVDESVIAARIQRSSPSSGINLGRWEANFATALRALKISPRPSPYCTPLPAACESLRSKPMDWTPEFESASFRRNRHASANTCCAAAIGIDRCACA